LANPPTGDIDDTTPLALYGEKLSSSRNPHGHKFRAGANTRWLCPGRKRWPG